MLPNSAHRPLRRLLASPSVRHSSQDAFSIVVPPLHRLPKPRRSPAPPLQSWTESPRSISVSPPHSLPEPNHSDDPSIVTPFLPEPHRLDTPKSGLNKERPRVPRERKKTSSSWLSFLAPETRSFLEQGEARPRKPRPLSKKKRERTKTVHAGKPPVTAVSEAPAGTSVSGLVKEEWIKTTWKDCKSLLLTSHLCAEAKKTCRLDSECPGRK
jgi:hypothetical protein